MAHYGHNSSLLTELSTGDLIEVNVGIFSSHWGVYVGGQNVIHLVGLRNHLFAVTSQNELFSISGETFHRAEARLDNFWTFVGPHRNKAEINNSLDNRKRPLSAMDIVRRAQSSIGEIDYCPKTKSCENFAKWCRYGDDNNDEDFGKTVAGVAGAVAGIAGLALGAFALYKAFSGGKKEEEDANYSSSSSEDEPLAISQAPPSARSQGSRYQKEDRYFGRFRCNKCHHQWESANVYTWQGTKKVKYGQKCIRCNEDFIKPYELQLILCSVCGVRPCRCRCEDCGKLKNKPTKESMPSSGYGCIDEHYCSCGKRRNKDLGDRINPKKHHPSDFCQRCQSGIFCTLHPDNIFQ